MGGEKWSLGVDGGEIGLLVELMVAQKWSRGVGVMIDGAQKWREMKGWVGVSGDTRVVRRLRSGVKGWVGM